jgi:hypothetical protein
VVAFFFLADWPMQYLRVLWRFKDYLPLFAPGKAFFTWWPGVGRQLGWALTVFLSLVLAAEWLLAWRKDFRWFYWTACLTLVFYPWIGLPSEPSQFVMLLPALALVFSVWEERMGKGGRWLVIASLLLLGVGLWLVFIRKAAGSFYQLEYSFLFQLPFFLIVGLYWVRWWVIRPARLFLEELRAREMVQ